MAPVSAGPRGGTIRKSILIALLLFALYNAVAALLMERSWFFLIQHQWQRNVTVAQEYLYNRKDSAVVIVGSSMSAALDVEMFPRGYYNLALAGRSSFDGLEIIRRSGARPVVLLVEANVLTRVVDEDFVDSLFVPAVSSMRRHMPALRAQNSPASLLMGLTRIGPEIIRRRLGLTGNAAAPKQSTEAGRTNSAAFETALKLQLEAQAALPARAELDQRLAVLRGYVDEFRDRGTDVLLFEMPCDERVFMSAGPAYVRRTLRERLPPAVHAYLPLPDCRQYVTTDTAHLDPSSAHRFAAFLARHVEARRERHCAEVGQASVDMTRKAGSQRGGR